MRLLSKVVFEVFVILFIVVFYEIIHFYSSNLDWFSRGSDFLCRGFSFPEDCRADFFYKTMLTVGLILSFLSMVILLIDVFAGRKLYKKCIFYTFLFFMATLINKYTGSGRVDFKITLAFLAIHWGNFRFIFVFLFEIVTGKRLAPVEDNRSNNAEGSLGREG